MGEQFVNAERFDALAAHVPEVKDTSNKPWRVYGLFDPRSMELRYIGKVEYTSIPKRVAQHVFAAKQGKSWPSSEWVRALLATGVRPKAIVLSSGVGEGAGLEEIRLIAMYREIGAQLTNITDGGEGCTGWKATAVQKERNSARQRGRTLSVEHREAISRGGMGKKASEQHKANISKALKGRVFSDEWRKNISLSHAGRKYGPMSEEQKEKISRAQKGRVFTAEHRARISAAARNRKKRT